ncbi:ACT domain-containing protein [Paenibacillus amylolyticus]|uniref:ACT domain-containing protein n=1 Tax=Paenibacillus amylolyticus TaxID=1451 RepID=A0AAP5H7A2_PAEAM|nr:ACT domain-containing protein [Paenibacillus amylolyticus]
MTSKAARFQIIEDLRARHGLAWLLKLAVVSRSGYYKWRKSIAAAKERRHKEHELESHLLAIHRAYLLDKGYIVSQPVENDRKWLP